ncbi:unnamed protein product [Natator depressus]
MSSGRTLESVRGWKQGLKASHWWDAPGEDSVGTEVRESLCVSSGPCSRVSERWSTQWEVPSEEGWGQGVRPKQQSGSRSTVSSFGHRCIERMSGNWKGSREG